MHESRASDGDEPSVTPGPLGLSDLLVLCGLVFVIGGAAFIHPAAGAIALGAALVIFGARRA